MYSGRRELKGEVALSVVLHRCGGIDNALLFLRVELSSVEFFLFGRREAISVAGIDMEAKVEPAGGIGKETKKSNLCSTGGES